MPGMGLHVHPAKTVAPDCALRAARCTTREQPARRAPEPRGEVGRQQPQNSLLALT